MIQIQCIVEHVLGSGVCGYLGTYSGSLLSPGTWDPPLLYTGVFP